MLQIIISALAWITLHFCRSWAKYIAFTLSLPFRGTNSRDLAVRWQNKIKDHRQVSILTHAFVEFHKVQCFFVLVFQVTALVSIYYAEHSINAIETVFGASSWSQLINSISFVRGIAVLSPLPLVATLLSLHKSGANSAFLLSITTGATITSFATWVAVRKVKESELRPKVLVESCGFNDLLSYCQPNLPYLLADDLSRDFGRSLFAFYACIIIILWCNQMFEAQDRGNERPASRNLRWLWTKVSGLLEKSQIFQTSHWATVSGNGPVFVRLRCLASYLRFPFLELPDLVIELFLFYYTIFYVIFIAVYITDGDPFVYGAKQAMMKVADPSNWNWGQIVAVTIWIPCFVEYVYLAFCEFKPVLTVRSFASRSFPSLSFDTSSTPWLILFAASNSASSSQPHT